MGELSFLDSLSMGFKGSIEFGGTQIGLENCFERTVDGDGSVFEGVGSNLYLSVSFQ